MSDTECYCMVCETFFEGNPQDHKCATPHLTSAASSPSSPSASVIDFNIDGQTWPPRPDNAAPETAYSFSLEATGMIGSGPRRSATDTKDSSSGSHPAQLPTVLDSMSIAISNSSSNNCNNNSNNINLQCNICWDKAFQLLISQNVLKGKEEEFKSLLDDSGIESVNDMPYVSHEIRSKLASSLKDAKRAQFLESCGM